MGRDGGVRPPRRRPGRPAAAGRVGGGTRPRSRRCWRSRAASWRAASEACGGCPATAPVRLLAEGCVALAAAADGTTWIATEEALFRDEGGRLLGPFAPPEDVEPPLRCLAASRDRLWVVHGGGRRSTAPAGTTRGSAARSAALRPAGGPPRLARRRRAGVGVVRRQRTPGRRRPAARAPARPAGARLPAVRGPHGTRRHARRVGPARRTSAAPAAGRRRAAAPAARRTSSPGPAGWAGSPGRTGSPGTCPSRAASPWSWRADGRPPARAEHARAARLGRRLAAARRGAGGPDQRPGLDGRRALVGGHGARRLHSAGGGAELGAGGRAVPAPAAAPRVGPLRRRKWLWVATDHEARSAPPAGPGRCWSRGRADGPRRGRRAVGRLRARADPLRPETAKHHGRADAGELGLPGIRPITALAQGDALWVVTPSATFQEPGPSKT